MDQQTVDYLAHLVGEWVDVSKPGVRTVSGILGISQGLMIWSPVAAASGFITRKVKKQGSGLFFPMPL